MSDDDWSSNVSWPEYTEKDFQEIDRLCEESRRDSDRTIHAEGSSSSGKSPFAEFRPRGYLTVTDLVAPAWCEVQYDYGLRQLRSRPIKERPQTFVTTKGKEIKVEAKVAAKNEDIMDRGKIVHKKLEREIHKEEVRIKVKTKEEFWALSLFDFLVRLKAIKYTSVVRELPIWGIIQDQPVYGKIVRETQISGYNSGLLFIKDELRLEISDVANGTGTESLTNPSKDRWKQTNLESFVARSEKVPPGHPSQILHIIDNKTRYNISIPSHADSLSSRLQLMLYCQMLSRALTSSDAGPSFSTFCARIGLKPTRKFSEAFMTEMASLVVENGLSLHFLDAKCLKDMDFPYQETIRDMGLNVEGCVSKRLSVVYRLRGMVSKKLKASAGVDEAKASQDQEKKPVIIKEVAEETNLVADEDEESIKLAPPTDGTVDVPEPGGQDVPCPKEAEKGSNDADQASASEIKTSDSRKRKRNRTSSSKAGSSTEAVSDSPAGESGSSSDSSTDSPKSRSGFIIGTKKFQYNETLLTAHLSSVLAWWHGKRPPHGVSIEDVGRCNTCEYKNGCEWREQKALEALEKARAKSAVADTARAT